MKLVLRELDFTCCTAITSFDEHHTGALVPNCHTIKSNVGEM